MQWCWSSHSQPVCFRVGYFTAIAFSLYGWTKIQACSTVSTGDNNDCTHILLPSSQNYSWLSESEGCTWYAASVTPWCSQSGAHKLLVCEQLCGLLATEPVSSVAGALRGARSRRGPLLSVLSLRTSWLCFPGWAYCT